MCVKFLLLLAAYPPVTLERENVQTGSVVGVSHRELRKFGSSHSNADAPQQVEAPCEAAALHASWGVWVCSESSSMPALTWTSKKNTMKIRTTRMFEKEGAFHSCYISYQVQMMKPRLYYQPHLKSRTTAASFFLTLYIHWKQVKKSIKYIFCL